MKRVLFAGYAPVHFVCFEPIYRRLVEHPDIRVELSGGRDADKNGLGELSAADLYRPFDVPEDQVVELPEMYERSYDLVFSSHISGFFPKEDRKRVQVFHGLSFRNMAVRRDVLIYDNLFVAGPYMMRALVDAKLFRAGDPRLVPTGFVKVDRLVDGSLDREGILARAGMTGERPVVLYAPTGQKGASIETTGPEVIRRLGASGRYDVLVKLHDHPRDRSEPWREEIEELQDEHTHVVTDFDIVPWLFAADLLVTDASSVSSEYSLLDRPMVFLDVPDLIRAAEANKKGRFDLDTWGRHAGVVARWPDQAVEAVEWSLENPEAHGSIRRAMAEDLFYHPGNATEAGVRWTLAELGLRPPARLVEAAS
ncbi:MAG TPA: CDP-glycerol glycerophosphotransferase family protein [Longimicrobiales bacterium]|nr:CDP-glycerol glycerophosphotransferase family protein [Longimicrobiales bacterium]